MTVAKPVRLNWGLRLLRASGHALDWLDWLSDDLTLMWAHWRLLRRARSRSPIDRVLIACGQEIMAASRAHLARGEPGP